MNDKEIEMLWKKLGNVPFMEKKDYSLVLESDWKYWKAGTDRETIWHWFDDHHSKGVIYLLYGK